MKYVKGLTKAEQAVSGSEYEQQFSELEEQLLALLRQEQREGSTELTRRDKTRIVVDLNRIVLAVTGSSFNALCL